jgi:hypothetical protein
MILPQIIELKSTNCQELKEGKVMMRTIVNAHQSQSVPAVLDHYKRTTGN